jgi:hypothetical protein
MSLIAGRLTLAPGEDETVPPPGTRVTPAGRRLRSAYRDPYAAETANTSSYVGGVPTVIPMDAAAHWLEEPSGDEYAWALLGAVTDAPTQALAYGELLGPSGGR